MIAVGLTVNDELVEPPLPVNCTVCGVPVLFATLSVAERLPLPVGVKVTEIEALALGAMLIGKVVGAKAKSPGFAPDDVIPVT